MENQQKAKILAALNAHKLAVISTVGSNTLAPESALIAFTEDSELCIYFQTRKHTRKAVNLKSNSQVSLVIGLDLDDLITIQYEGSATRISDIEDVERCKKRFIDKNSPTTAKHFNNPDTLFFKVSPKWVSYSDYSSQKPEVIEIKEFS